jgi:hypothetical protein
MQTEIEIAAEVKRAVKEALAEYDPTERRLWSVRNWAKAHDMGLTFVYAEIKAGRLKAVQVGDRMMIRDENGREYLAKLPELQAA